MQMVYIFLLVNFNVEKNKWVGVGCEYLHLSGELPGHVVNNC